MAAELEPISLGSCPICGAPAQFIDPQLVDGWPEGAGLHVAVGKGGAKSTYVRHVDLRDVPLRRVARELEALRSGAKGLARVAYADALSLVERELEEVKGS